MSVWLTACADQDPPPVPPPTTNVTTNTTYNNTIIYEKGGPSPEASVVEAPAPAPRNISHGATPRDVATTGVPECDAYLTRVESCSRGLLPRTTQSDALDRITAGLDTARRAWREAAQNPSARPGLARTCSDSLTQYNESVKNVICE